MDFKNIIKRIAPENKAGLYITVIFHLTVIIVLLIVQIGAIRQSENSFVLDFSKQEERERLAEEAAFKEEISRHLDELIKTGSAQSHSIRNIAVDASISQLKDDRGTDAEQLYKDAERLAEQLKGGRQAIEEDAREETVDMSGSKQKEDNRSKEYKGPSVVSYALDGRKASHLKIPAYRCMGGGDVVVTIVVDPQGNVLDAKINEAVSSSDKCLTEYAKRAARLSRFAKSATAPSRQYGEIVYRFIPQ